MFQDVSMCEELILFFWGDVPTAGSVIFSPHPIFSPFEAWKKNLPLLSMWSDSSTPLKLAAGGHVEYTNRISSALSVLLRLRMRQKETRKGKRN
jgi:hypothetical protein